MDIKFIGSGTLVKATLVYIIDYITKSQLKTHVAFAALELAVRCLGECNHGDDNQTVQAKCLLQKCACVMISHQELSAQQVCSYLMDYKDHFTSHSFNNLQWTSFELFVDKQDPSPECTHCKQAGDGMTTTSEPTTDAEVWDSVENGDQSNLDQTDDDDDRPEKVKNIMKTLKTKKLVSQWILLAESLLGQHRYLITNFEGMSLKAYWCGTLWLKFKRLTYRNLDLNKFLLMSLTEIKMKTLN